MYFDLCLLLQMIHAAFNNQQPQLGMFFLNYVIQSAHEIPSSADIPLETAIALDPGLKRSTNEDCVCALQGFLPTQESFGLFLICDGMGGHAAGLEAATLAVQTVVASLVPHLFDTPYDRWKSLLVQAVARANQAIYQRNCQQVPTLQATQQHHETLTRLMGTTITVVLLHQQTAFIANVGDSRAYLYQPQERLTQLTRDHSVVAQLVARSLISEEEAYQHPRRNEITRCLGTAPTIEVDQFVATLPPDSSLLLCSDGLWEMTSDTQIEEILAHSSSPTATQAQQFLALAKQEGGKDNIGLVIIHIKQPSASINQKNTPLLPFRKAAR